MMTLYQFATLPFTEEVRCVLDRLTRVDVFARILVPR
jgi:hypothetical protein